MLKNTLLLLLVASLSLLAAEAVLRNFYPIHGIVYELDDHFLHKLVPDARKIYVRNQGGAVEKILVSINSAGFRGEELQTDKSVRRIVVYGDSFIEAEYSQLEDTFPFQLEQKLRAAMGAPVEVINGGVVAYGPDQASLKIESEIDELRPDLIILSIFAGNDFGDLLRNKIYQISSSGEVSVKDYRLDDSLRSFFRAANPSILMRSLKSMVKRILKFFQKLISPPESLEEKGVKLLDDFLRMSKEEFSSYLDNNQVVNLFGDHYDADISMEPDGKSSRYKIRLMGGVLSRIRDTAARHNVPLIMLIIPSPIDAANGYDWQVDPITYPEYRRSRLTDILEEIAESNAIEYVNLFDVYRSRDANSLYYHYGNNHWNAAGQELAAELMKNFLLAKPRLPSVETAEGDGSL